METNAVGSGVVLKIPYPCKYVEFTVSDSTYGQYGICTEYAVLPAIHNTGDGRIVYQTYESTGTYRIQLNGIAAQCVFITLNSGNIRDIRVVMMY